MNVSHTKVKYYKIILTFSNVFLGLLGARAPATPPPLELRLSGRYVARNSNTRLTLWRFISEIPAWTYHAIRRVHRKALDQTSKRFERKHISINTDRSDGRENICFVCFRQTSPVITRRTWADTVKACARDHHPDGDFWELRIHAPVAPKHMYRLPLAYH